MSDAPATRWISFRTPLRGLLAARSRTDPHRAGWLKNLSGGRGALSARCSSRGWDTNGPGRTPRHASAANRKQAPPLLVRGGYQVSAPDVSRRRPKSWVFQVRLPFIQGEPSVIKGLVAPRAGARIETSAATRPTLGSMAVLSHLCHKAATSMITWESSLRSQRTRCRRRALAF